MVSDLAKLTNAIEQVATNGRLGALEQRILSLRSQITEALQTKGEYILTDETGQSYLITASVGGGEDE